MYGCCSCYGCNKHDRFCCCRTACKNNVKVYAVVREKSPNLSRLNQFKDINIVECSLDSLAGLTEKIKEKCNVFYHFAWAHTGAKEMRI